jgi:hypothetical protein
MLRYKAIVLIAACFGVFSCQQYNQGLEKSVTRADEVGAISALRTVLLAQRSYSLSNNGSYGTFQELVKAGALDAERFDAEKPKLRGYVLAMTITKGSSPEPYSFTLTADLETPGTQPGRHFFVYSSGMMHANPTQPASVRPPVSQ